MSGSREVGDMRKERRVGRMGQGMREKGRHEQMGQGIK